MFNQRQIGPFWRKMATLNRFFYQKGQIWIRNRYIPDPNTTWPKSPGSYLGSTTLQLCTLSLSSSKKILDESILIRNTSVKQMIMVKHYAARSPYFTYRPRVWTLAWTGKAAASRRAAWDLPLPSHPVNTSTASPPRGGRTDSENPILSSRIMDPHWFNAFFLIADPDPVNYQKRQKLKKIYNWKIFFFLFWIKITIYLSLCLHKGRTSYSRSLQLQPSKENI